MRLITARTYDRNVSSVFSNSQFPELPRCQYSTLVTGVAQRLARGAHNSEVTGSNPVSGISHSRVYRIRPAVTTHTATLTPLAQRQSTLAHNSGVTRSKLVGGKTILTRSSWTTAALTTPSKRSLCESSTFIALRKVARHATLSFICHHYRSWTS